MSNPQQVTQIKACIIISILDCTQLCYNVVSTFLFLDPSLNVYTLKTLLEKHSINYASLNAELRIPLLLKGGSSSMIGVKLWLLTNPSCSKSWTDFAVALYNSHMDDALNELKKNYIPMTGLCNCNCACNYPMLVNLMWLLCFCNYRYSSFFD